MNTEKGVKKERKAEINRLRKERDCLMLELQEGISSQLEIFERIDKINRTISIVLSMEENDQDRKEEEIKNTD